MMLYMSNCITSGGKQCQFVPLLVLLSLITWLIRWVLCPHYKGNIALKIHNSLFNDTLRPCQYLIYSTIYYIMVLLLITILCLNQLLHQKLETILQVLIQELSKSYQKISTKVNSQDSHYFQLSLNGIINQIIRRFQLSSLSSRITSKFVLSQAMTITI